MYLPTLEQFLSDLSQRPYNSYIQRDNFSSLYVRKGPYRIGFKNVVKTAIQIANVEVIKKRKGSLKKLITDIVNLCPNVPLVFENVQPEWLKEKLLSIGFERIIRVDASHPDLEDYDACFVLKPKEEQSDEVGHSGNSIQTL